MEKRTYTRPSISETKLDAEINLVMSSTLPPGDGELPEGGFINPLKWFTR